MPSYRRQMTLFAHLNKSDNFNSTLQNQNFDDQENDDENNFEPIDNEILEDIVDKNFRTEGIDGYLKAIGKYPILSKEEEYRSINLAHQGDSIARNKVINANLRLVVRIARRYIKQPGMTLPDLIEEGNLGLMHALDKFDVSLGHRFSTYAAWWIQQDIERAIMNQSRVVRLPVHIIKDLNKCQRAYNYLMHEQNKKPTFKEIASFIERTQDRVEHVLQFQDSSVSLDATLLHAPTVLMSHELAVEEPLNPYKALEQKDTLDLVEVHLDSLPENHYEVIIRRFGLRGHDPMTLDAVAAELGLTREAVRQTQLKAINSIHQKIGYLRD